MAEDVSRKQPRTRAKRNPESNPAPEAGSREARRDPKAVVKALNVLLAEGRYPTIFMFRPTSVELVPPDKLIQWEQAMRERVGLDVRRGNPRGTESYTKSPTDYPGGWDDCDDV